MSIVDAAAQIASPADIDLDDGALDAARAALVQRLRAALEVIHPSEALPNDPTILLDHLLEALARRPHSDTAWLVLVSLTTVMPRMADVEALMRQCARAGVISTRIWLLGFTLPLTRERGNLLARMTIVQDQVIVDVNFSATDEHNTGIQRVVRRTMPSWVRDHDITLVAWSVGSFRILTPRERHRVVEWDTTRPFQEKSDLPLIVVPWKSRVILAEVPSRAYMCDPVSALARYSGNTVSLIGFDAIPVVSAETVPVDMADHFAKYLTVVKWADSVAAISAAAASEFVGFGQMLASQGLAGPRVVACSLPADPVRVIDGAGRVRERPLVVVVGSKEPRKNHVAVLFAAERLWREGLDFELFFVGSFGWDTRLFRAWLSRLKRAGRPVNAPVKVGDTELWRAYSEARFSVFPSLHEGYGLPVAESLAYGTPVITTGYGSTGEIAADGGCLTVDPRDDEQILDAMRSLLTDDVLLERLRVEALARPVKTWDDYAAEVWAVVGGSREG